MKTIAALLVFALPVFAGFEDGERIIAAAPQRIIEVFPALFYQYGENCQDGDESIRTIGAFWDDTEKTRKRAASLSDGTIAAIPLMDGRVAYRCLWQTDLAAAFAANQIEGISELTPSELEQLRFKGEFP